MRREKKNPSWTMPRLIRHAKSGRAYVLLDGKKVFLSMHGTMKCWRDYARRVTTWLATTQCWEDGDEWLDKLRTVSDRLAIVPEIGRSPGVYFLICDKQVMYVGQSIAVVSRVSTHRQTRQFDFAVYMPCDENMLDVVERLWIDRLLPPWNMDSRTRSWRSSSKVGIESPPIVEGRLEPAP